LLLITIGLGGAYFAGVFDGETAKTNAGVYDLIGNVREWTDTKANVYPGSNGEVKAAQKNDITIRGGSAKEKPSDGISSTFRFNLAPNAKDKTLGFRLVSSEQ
jgi:formylglycine-generating enzyme required for sulfatase activity